MSTPWISVNLAISADGKISPERRIPSGWTSAADHQRLLDLRRGADALLVGKGTLVADQMTLTVPGEIEQPLRCIVSRSGEIDPNHPVFHRPGGQIHWCSTTGADGPEIPGVTVHRSSLADFLTILGTTHGARRIHCEGGGQLVRELMELDRIDEFHLTVAGHTLFGGARSPTPTGVPGDFACPSRGFQITAFEFLREAGESFLTCRRMG